MATYLETGEAEVTNFDFEVIIHENILRLDVSMNNAQCVHILIDSGSVQSNLESLFHRDFDH